MNSNEYKIETLKLKNCNEIIDIWTKSLPENLKSIIGKEIINNYIQKFFKIKENFGCGIFKSNELIGFILFGKDNAIIEEIKKEKFKLIIFSFFKNLLLLKLNKILNYLDVLIFLLLSQNKEKIMMEGNCELLIIAIKNEEQNKGIGSDLLKDSLKIFKKNFSNYNYIYVKTLNRSERNLHFYKRNKFEVEKSIFGRVYLKFNTQSLNSKP